MNKYTISSYVDLMASEGLLTSASILDENVTVQYITFNSKTVLPGTLFVCKGAAFKKDYLMDALGRGAIGYISEVEYELPEPVSHIIVSDIRKAMPHLGNLFYNRAWESLNVIAFGGTKGKSTASSYMKAIVDDYMAATDGKESAILSSIDNYDGVIREESHLTTPEALNLHEHFRHAVDSGITYLEMEVSSQALKYDRVSNVRFDVSVFLNISEDHISPIEHPDFEDYLTSKMMIFGLSEHSVINMDADFSDRIRKAAEASSNVITFSQKDPDVDFYAYDIHRDTDGTHFHVRCKDFDESFILTMPGLFNVENAVATICAAHILNIPMEYIKSGLLRARTSGRMEVFKSADNKLVAIVDYAHNKISFEKLFQSAHIEYPGHKVIAVFGAPGGKALIRREGLATVARELADRIYLTADDPGPESVSAICRELVSYLEPANCPYEIIEDRCEAIHRAIMDCEQPSVILIAGKGNDATQKVGTTLVPYETDTVIAKRCLAEYDGKVRS